MSGFTGEETGFCIECDFAELNLARNGLILFSDGCLEGKVEGKLTSLAVTFGECMSVATLSD